MTDARPSSVGLRPAIVELLAALSLLLALRFLHYESRLLAYWPQWEPSEAWSLHHAMLLARGEPLYRVREAPPLVVPQYGFVYPAIVVPALEVLGHSLLAPRLVSLVCVLGLLAGVAYAVRALGSPWAFSAIAVGLVVLKVNWWRWLVLSRPDGLGTLLLFLSLLAHWRWPRSRIALVLAVLLLVAAFFTKVYFVLGAASLFLSYALVHRDRLWTWRFLGLFLLVFGAALGGVLAWTGGLYWVFTFRILSILLRYSAPLAPAYLAAFLVGYLPLWLVLVDALVHARLDVRRYSVFFVHILVATPATALLLMNDGGGAYYWYLVLPALVVVGCHVLAQETARPESRVALPALLLTLVLMLATAGYAERLPSAAFAERWAPLRDQVASAPGPVMNSNLTAILNIAAGKELYTEAVGFARNARWLRETYGYRFLDPRKRIRERYYALLLDPEGTNPEGTPGLDDDYMLSETLELPGQFGAPERVRVYVPRPDHRRINQP